MSLFQKSVVLKHLQSQNKTVLQEKWQQFQNHFHNSTIQENIRNSKEEQYQGEFLIDLFVAILGYTKNPQPGFNLTTEYKNVKDSKKADGAIVINQKVTAVIELKGTNTTDLGKIETQAFGYKNNQPECVYVVTSNFEKLRFYIDNAIEHLEFNLFKLTQEEFNLLYLCLAHENISRDISRKIKNESVSQEDVITKKLYKDYSLFKRELYQNMVALNPDYEPLELFKKSQKLLDRFLFVFFAEDRNLLPTNLIFRINKEWKQLREMRIEVSLYDRYKIYFNDLNSGAKVSLPAFSETVAMVKEEHQIFAYNGGLFKPDEMLDNIRIDDVVLFSHTEKLSHYDFASEVDVNILGHIFENSLNELDETKAQLEGQEIDKTKTKRKKDGVFYTPKYITKYIVENTIGKLCIEKKAELQLLEEDYTTDKKRQKKTMQGLVAKLEEYRKWLLQLTICDPACGSGAFLNQALDFLIEEHRYVDELQAKLFGDALVLSDIENSILENNLFGVDLNDESVEIAKLSLWLRTAQPNRKLNDLNSNIKCGNSLIDDPTVAGDKAFNWHEAFPQVFANGGFDVIIGNPPYVRAELLSVYKDYFSKKFEIYNSASDLFSYFYELGVSLIKEKGIMGFISNTFDKTNAGFVLRNYLQSKTIFEKYIDFTEVQIFEGATTYPVIIILNKKITSIEREFEFIKIPKSSQAKTIDIELHKNVIVNQDLLSTEAWSFSGSAEVDLLKKISNLPTIKEKYGKCYYGVKTALNDAFIIKEKYKSGNIKPIYEGKEIKKWITPNSEQNLILFESKWTKKTYGNEITESEALEKLKVDFPEIMKILLPFEDLAKKRYDKGDFWWELRNCAYYDLFEKPKIIFPNLQNTNKFAHDNEGVYINAPAVFLPVPNKTLLCILNSKLVWKFLLSICVVRSGGYIEVKPQYFEQIPIPNITEEQQQLLIKKADLMLSLNKELQEVSQKLHRTIQRKFDLEDLPKKLQDWYLLSYTEFIKELAKKKIKLSLSDEAEWEEYFNQESKKALVLKNQIDTTDKEIDQMVYELYGLSEEEIFIVEGV